MQIIFALSSGRSGTSFLAHFLNKNVANSRIIHEPLFQRWINPSLFGKPIYCNARQQYDQLQPYLARKKKYIERRGEAFYYEGNHALMKSAHTLLLNYFPDCKFVHLIRNPLQVAKSEANREAHLLHMFKLPWVDPGKLRYFYQAGNGRPYFMYALTGLEKIFEPFDLTRLSRFEFYLIQWIEIENRIMGLLNQYNKHQDCFTLHTPYDLKDVQRLEELVRFFQFDCLHDSFNLNVSKNKTPGKKTIITDEDRRAFEQILQQIDPQYLEIFQYAPYSDLPWVTELLNHPTAAVYADYANVFANKAGHG